jgi:hypothetical protein
MSIFRLIASVILLFLACGITFGNWSGTLQAYRNRKNGIPRGYSQIPFLSLIFCALASLVYPFRPWWWILIPTALDPGTWVLLYLPVVIWRQWPLCKPSNEELEPEDKKD